MASLQEPGTVKLYHEISGRGKILVYESHVSRSAPAGGSPEGALTSVTTPEKLEHAMPVGRDKGYLSPNIDFLTLEFTAEGADGIDVSDCIWQIPMQRPDGTVFILSRGNFANPAPADYTTVANIPVIVGRWLATEKCRFGGGKPYIDLQDDTA